MSMMDDEADMSDMHTQDQDATKQNGLITGEIIETGYESRVMVHGIDRKRHKYIQTVAVYIGAFVMVRYCMYKVSQLFDNYYSPLSMCSKCLMSCQINATQRFLSYTCCCER